MYLWNYWTDEILKFSLILSIKIMVFWDVKLWHLVERRKWTSTVFLLMHSGTGICTYLPGGSEGQCSRRKMWSTAATQYHNFPSLPLVQRIWASYISTLWGNLLHPSITFQNIIILMFKWVCLNFILLLSKEVFSFNIGLIQLLISKILKQRLIICLKNGSLY